jgi:hypothetical protein
MSIKNLFLGDFNKTLDIYCNHLNCGEIDIKDDKIKNVNEITSNIIYGTHLYIKNMNVYDYILSLEKTNEDKITILQNQIDDLKKVIYQLTNINLIA